MADVSAEVRKRVRARGFGVLVVGLVWAALAVGLAASGALGSMWDSQAEMVGGPIKLFVFALLGTLSIGWIFAVLQGLRILITGKDEDFEREVGEDVAREERQASALEKTLVGDDNVTCCGFSPDGRLLAAGGLGWTALWETSSGEKIAAPPSGRGMASSLAFSPDGGVLASCTGDESVRLWDTRVGEEKPAMQPEHAVELCAFSPDGKVLAAAGTGSTDVTLWDMPSGTQRAILTGHGAGITSCSFSPDGSILATASKDETIKLWDPATGAELRAVAPGNKIHWCDFSPDGSVLAGSSSDNFMRYWDPNTGETIGEFNFGISEGVDKFSFSQDGTVVWNKPNDVFVSALMNSKRTSIIKEKWSSSIDCCSVSRDGRLLATGRAKEIKIWDMRVLTQAVELRPEDADTAPAELTGQAGGDGDGVAIPAVPIPTAPIPANWCPDPAKRHDYRYWDGTRWTEQVSDAGKQSVDPIPEQQAPQATPAPGWYANPEGPGQRYWDGAQWTEQLSAPTPIRRPRHGGWWVPALGVLAVVGVLLAVLFFAVFLPDINQKNDAKAALTEAQSLIDRSYPLSRAATSDTMRAAGRVAITRRVNRQLDRVISLRQQAIRKLAPVEPLPLGDDRYDSAAASWTSELRASIRSAQDLQSVLQNALQSFTVLSPLTTTIAGIRESRDSMAARDAQLEATEEDTVTPLL